MNAIDELFSAYARGFEAQRDAEMTLPEYLDDRRSSVMVTMH